jgi:hypothetical protein
MLENETKNNLEICVEISVENNKLLVKNLQEYSDNMKNTIKDIEETFNVKSIKKKNFDECCFEELNAEKFKTYLSENLKIKEENIKIIYIANEQDEQEEQKKREKLILSKINKKIGFQLLKEKNKNKTFLTNINLFMEKDEIQILCKKLQKILGSSSILNQDGDCGFSGDYTTDTSKREIIKNFILENTKISKQNLDF